MKRLSNYSQEGINKIVDPYWERDEPKDIYVEIVEGIRKGTIGIIEKFEYAYSYTNGKYVVGSVRVSCKGKRTFTEEEKYCELLELGKDYETKYCRDMANAPITKDVLGNPITIGTLVAFAQSDILNLGTVKRINERGSIFVSVYRRGRNIKEREDSPEIKIPYPASGTLVVKDESLDQIMIDKLTLF